MLFAVSSKAKMRHTHQNVHGVGHAGFAMGLPLLVHSCVIDIAAHASGPFTRRLLSSKLKAAVETNSISAYEKG